jgi:hypothetical protein
MPRTDEGTLVEGDASEAQQAGSRGAAPAAPRRPVRVSRSRKWDAPTEALVVAALAAQRATLPPLRDSGGAKFLRLADESSEWERGGHIIPMLGTVAAGGSGAVAAVLPWSRRGTDEEEVATAATGSGALLSGSGATERVKALALSVSYERNSVQQQRLERSWCRPSMEGAAPDSGAASEGGGGGSGGGSGGASPRTTRRTSSRLKDGWSAALQFRNVAASDEAAGSEPPLPALAAVLLPAAAVSPPTEAGACAVAAALAAAAAEGSLPRPLLLKDRLLCGLELPLSLLLAFDLLARASRLPAASLLQWELSAAAACLQLAGSAGHAWALAARPQAALRHRAVLWAARRALPPALVCAAYLALGGGGGCSPLQALVAVAVALDATDVPPAVCMACLPCLTALYFGMHVYAGWATATWAALALQAAAFNLRPLAAYATARGLSRALLAAARWAPPRIAWLLPAPALVALAALPPGGGAGGADGKGDSPLPSLGLGAGALQAVARAEARLRRATPWVQAFAPVASGLLVVAANLLLPEELPAGGSRLAGPAGGGGAGPEHFAAATLGLLHLAQLAAAGVGLALVYAAVMALQVAVSGSPLLADPRAAAYDAALRDLSTLSDAALAAGDDEELLEVVRTYAAVVAPGCTVLLIQHDDDATELVQVVQACATLRAAGASLALGSAPSGSLPSALAACATGQALFAAAYPPPAGDARHARYADWDSLHAAVGFSAFLTVRRCAARVAPLARVRAA